MSKPMVFNYREYEKLLEENRKLRDDIANLQIRCRIAEAGRPEWIPVSERLPEKDGRYLVTCPLLGGGLEVLTVWYGTPLKPISPVKGKCFFDSDDEWGDVPYDDVVTWMPLPEAYKGGDRE